LREVKEKDETGKLKLEGARGMSCKCYGSPSPLIPLPGEREREWPRENAENAQIFQRKAAKKRRRKYPEKTSDEIFPFQIPNLEWLRKNVHSLAANSSSGFMILPALILPNSLRNTQSG
jgi:hypothetical protein